MRLHGLDLNLLVALDALLNERNVTRAADRLHMSQSAASHALSRLRRQLADELLVPVGRRMVPTPFGQVLARQVRELLVQIDATIKARPEFDPRESDRHFVLAASDYATNVLLLEVQRRLDTLAPGVALEILPVIDSSVQALRMGEIDFMVFPDRYRIAELPSATLFTDRLVCIKWRENTTLGARLTVEEFRRQDHVVFQPDPGHVIALDAWLRDHYQLKPAVKLAVPSYGLVPPGVAGTGRIATIPERLARRFEKSLNLSIIEPEFEMPALVEVLQWSPVREQDAGHRWFRDLVLRVAAEVERGELVAPEPPRRSARKHRGRRKR
jgi:LysR family transcriptional regulator, nod-box dependent transcriptional activator